MRDNVHEVKNELTNMNAAANCIITVTLLILTQDYETNNNILCINPNDTIYLQPNDILGIASWNIESLRSKLRSNKRDINSIIQCYDIIGF